MKISDEAHLALFSLDLLKIQKEKTKTKTKQKQKKNELLYENAKLGFFNE